MSKFNQVDYIREYNKEHYKMFKVNLKSEEFAELDKLLKKNNLTKAQFLRNAIYTLKCQVLKKSDTSKK